jgi:glycosyltransferase involved in cell wall biosynthesis
MSTLPRILHAAVSMNPSPGVVRQMEWEQEAAHSLNIPWTTVLWTPIPIKSPIVRRVGLAIKNRLGGYLSLRREFYSWLVDESDCYDLVLLRYSVHDLFQSLAASRIGHKLVTLHHTLEAPEIRSSGAVSGHLVALLELVLGRWTLRHSLTQAAVTDEILQYEEHRRRGSGQSLLRLIYPNGIFPTEQSGNDERGTSPELVFVASQFVPWHGLDLLLESLSKNRNEACRLHLIGVLPEALVNQTRADPRVTIHGLLRPESLRKLMARAWLGLSSLALERKGMREACTLKVREYLDHGLPVYAGHRDSGLPLDFAYYKAGIADLLPILEYAQAVRAVRRDQVRVAALPYIDKKLILSQFYSLLSKQTAVKEENL